MRVIENSVNDLIESNTSQSFDDTVTEVSSTEVTTLGKQNSTDFKIMNTVNPADIFITTREVSEEDCYTQTTREVVPVDIVFAIDSSGSMGGSDPDNLRLDASKAFVDKLNPSVDRGAIVSWGSGIDFSSALTSEFAKLKTDINEAEDGGGGTNINSGLGDSVRIFDTNTRSGPR